MDKSARLLGAANTLYIRADTDAATATRPPIYKAIGISLAIASGLFIGVSFVLKKVGLLKANVKYNEAAGDGYSYLKNAYWWTGMTLMIIGEICNFVAYAFVDAILVTPMGALSVVITAILSAIFLKERLSLVGKVGCFLCIIGSVVIVMNAPSESSAATIQEMQAFVIAPGFLSYAGVVIAASIFTALWAGPRYGKKTMLVYISICSMIGGLSVVATQGLGAAIVTQISGTPQFNQWFIYVLLVFVVTTLLTEIIFLNKALNIFNAALVTPTYYVFFTSSTIVTSAILFRGFTGSPTSIVTVVMGFFVICAGVVLLQLSKSAKDVPDTAVFAGDVDQIRTIAEQEQPETEPKADAIRGTAAIVRRISMARQKWEAEEARRIQEDKQRDLEPINEGERIEWDGVRRRRTVVNRPRTTSSSYRAEQQHFPLGMSRFPNEEELRDEECRPPTAFSSNFLGSLRGRSRSMAVAGATSSGILDDGRGQLHPLTEILTPSQKSQAATRAYYGQGDGADYGLPANLHTGEGTDHVYGLPDNLHTAYEGVGLHSDNHTFRNGELTDRPYSRGLSSRGSVAPTPPPHTARRQFSFQNVFGKNKDHDDTPSIKSPRPSSGHRQISHKRMNSGATEEERLGLVKGDSHVLPALPTYEEEDDDGDWNLEPKAASSSGTPSPIEKYERTSDEVEEYESQRQRWNQSRGESPRRKDGGSGNQGGAFV